MLFFLWRKDYHADKVNRETQGKTLEEIAELFGDDLAFTEHIDTHVVHIQKDTINSKTNAQKLDATEERVEDVSG